MVFQYTLALHEHMSTLLFFFKKKKFFWCTSTQITLNFFHVNLHPHVSVMLDFKIFFVKPCVDN